MAEQKDTMTVQCSDGTFELARELYDTSVLVRDFLSAEIVKTWPMEQVEAEIDELLLK